MVIVVREEEEHGLVRAIRRGRRMSDDPARSPTCSALSFEFSSRSARAPENSP